MQLQSIMEETSTNIYLQSPLCNSIDEDNHSGLIYLTGESPSDLARAKDLLKKLTAQKVNMTTLHFYTTKIKLVCIFR